MQLPSHPGMEETYTTMQMRLFWVGTKKDIIDYIWDCSTRNNTKVNNNKNASSATQEKHLNQPWEVIAMDLMSPYPKTPSGKTRVLEVTELFTKWKEAFTIPKRLQGD